MYFVERVEPAAEDRAAHVGAALRPVLHALAGRLEQLDHWNAASIAQALKAVLAEHALKMPQLAPAVRVLVCGRASTPSIDAVLALFARETVLSRLRAA